MKLNEVFRKENSLIHKSGLLVTVSEW